MKEIKMSSENSKNSYNKMGFYFFLFTIGFSCLWASYFLIFNNRIDLGEYQKNQEAEQQGQALGDLWVSSKELIAKGSKVYKAQCALCHGVSGLGDGTPGLVPPPRNLVEGKWVQGGSSKAMYITLQKGISGTSMASFQHLPKADRWAVIHYVRSITKNKVPDDEKELEEFAKKAN